MKRMLLNATHPEELRVAIVDGQQLIDLDIESAVRTEKKGNIYKGVVTRVEPGLEAAFVDYGAERQGFLPMKEIYRGYFSQYDSKTPLSSARIDQEISEGQQMLVQVNKDERGSKGASLTTFISLAGRFLVLMPNNPKGGGISRRVTHEERSDLKRILANLNVGDQHALIARTAGIDRSPEELQWDLDFLLKLWSTVETAAADLTAPRLVYQESNLLVRSIRDHLAADIAEIVIDDRELFDRAGRFVKQMMPHNLAKLKHYDQSMPLFSRFQVEQQIESAFKREVRLPSGASVVIDHTEALTSIDVNSARATKGADIEETALQTNLEAVEEIARQLRIRDLGGLVVIDLIDMSTPANDRAVESRFRAALRPDRARVQIGKISRFGLLEMSRQRLRSSISDTNDRACPRCEGTGIIRSVVSASLGLLRLIEEKALQENIEALQVLLPLDMATYLLNEKRHEISQLEARLASRIIIIPSHELASPQYQLKRLRRDELDELDSVPSYLQKIEPERKEEDAIAALKSTAPTETPHIQLEQIQHRAPPAQREARPADAATPAGPAGSASPAPATRERGTAERAHDDKPREGKVDGAGGGLFSRLWKKLTGGGKPKIPAGDGQAAAGRGDDAARGDGRRRQQPRQGQGRGGTQTGRGRPRRGGGTGQPSGGGVRAGNRAGPGMGPGPGPRQPRGEQGRRPPGRRPPMRGQPPSDGDGRGAPPSGQQPPRQRRNFAPQPEQRGGPPRQQPRRPHPNAMPPQPRQRPDGYGNR